MKKETSKEVIQSLSKEVGLRLRLYRKEKKLTQEDLAEKAGLHYSYIGQVERGEKNITIGSLERILDALDIPFSDLFNNIEMTADPEDQDIYSKCYQLLRSRSERDALHLYAVLLEICRIQDEKN